MSQAYALKERGIVQREFDLRRPDDPLRETRGDITRASFGKGPYARSVLGTKESIEGFSLDRARALHDQTHYVSKATFLVRGPVTPSDLHQAIERLESWPSARTRHVPQALPIWPVVPHRIEDEYSLHGIGQPTVLRHATYTMPEGLSRADLLAARKILVHIVHSTKADGLVRPLRDDDFIARAFEYGVHVVGQQGLETWFTATPDKGGSLHALNAAVDRYLSQILRAPDRDSFEDVRARERAQIDGILDPLDTNSACRFEAMTTGSDYVALSDLRKATARLTFGTFQTFTWHLLTLRTAVVRLVNAA